MRVEALLETLDLSHDASGAVPGVGPGAKEVNDRCFCWVLSNSCSAQAASFVTWLRRRSLVVTRPMT